VQLEKPSATTFSLESSSEEEAVDGFAEEMTKYQKEVVTRS
jgi:hypothetical protein